MCAVTTNCQKNTYAHALSQLPAVLYLCPGHHEVPHHPHTHSHAHVPWHHDLHYKQSQIIGSTTLTAHNQPQQSHAWNHSLATIKQQRPHLQHMWQGSGKGEWSKTRQHPT